MGYMTHCPYKGNPYVRGENGRDVNGYESFTAFCDDHCPAEQSYPYELSQAYEDAKQRVENAPKIPRDGGMFAPVEIVLAANEAGRALNAHQRYGWAPTIGGTCSVCGESC